MENGAMTRPCAPSLFAPRPDTPYLASRSRISRQETSNMAVARALTHDDAPDRVHGLQTVPS